MGVYCLFAAPLPRLIHRPDVVLMAKDFMIFNTIRCRKTPYRRLVLVPCGKETAGLFGRA